MSAGNKFWFFVRFVLLSMITLGLYPAWWFLRVQEEQVQLSREIRELQKREVELLEELVDINSDEPKGPNVRIVTG